MINKTRHLPCFDSVLLDCSDNPKDLRLPAYAIMAAVNWLLDRLPSSTPIVILVGEHHEITTENQAPLAILSAFKKAGLKEKFAIGFEKPHTERYKIQDRENLEREADAYKAFRQSDLFEPIDFSNYEKNHLHYANKQMFFEKNLVKENISIEADPDGQKMLKLCFKHIAMYGAMNPVLKFCYQHNVSVSFNDIASDQDYLDCGENEASKLFSIVDQSDGLSREMIQRYAPHLINETIYRSSEAPEMDMIAGIMLSNRTMVHNAMAHIKRSQAKIYIQHCGLAHVAGDAHFLKGVTVNLPYKESLHRYFTQAGCCVISYGATYRENSNLPYDAGHAVEKNGIFTMGLDDEQPYRKGGKNFTDSFDEVNTASGGLLTLCNI